MSNHGDLLAEFLSKRHSVSKLIVHFIFTTKYRRKLFNSQMIAQLREAFSSTAAKLECEIIEMDGEPDHVHLLVAYPPKLAINVMVNNLKSVLSRLLRQQNAHLHMQSKTGLLWVSQHLIDL
ncbi:IS200/IS605 family transposase [Salmonella enterica]|nr:IS200/IS605 family transposase [Salmonella enterica]